MDKSHIMTVPTPSGNSIDTEAMRFMLLSTPGAWEQYQAFLKFQSSEKIQDDKPVESNSQCSMIVPTPSQAHGNSSMGELTPCLTKICLISNTFIGLHKTLVSQSPLPMPDISQTQNNRFGMRDTQDESFNTQRAINDSQPLHDLTDTTINNHEDVELDKSPCLSEQEPIHPTPEPSRKSVENNSDDEMDTDSVQSDDDHEIDDAAICDFESDDEGPPEECSKDLNLDAARKKKIRVCLPELMGTVNNRRESCQRRKVVASHSFEFLGHMDKALSKYHAIKQVKPAVQKVYNWIKHKEPDWKWSRIVVIKVMRQICQDNVKNANKAVNAKKRLQDIEVLKGRPKGKASKNKLKQASQENTAEFLVGQSTNTPLLNETQPITQVETQVSITSTTSASAESSTSSNTIIDDRYTRTPERNDNDLNNQTDIIMSTELTDLPMNLDFSHRKNNAPALLPEMKASPSLTQMATSTGFKLPNNGVIVKPKPTSSSSANDAKNVKSQTWMQVMNIPVTFTSAYNPVPGESFYVIRTPMGKHFKFALRYEFNTFQEAMATFLNVDELEVQKGFHYTIEGHSECILSFPDEYARMILKIANRNPIVVSIRPQDSEKDFLDPDELGALQAAQATLPNSQSTEANPPTNPQQGTPTDIPSDHSPPPVEAVIKRKRGRPPKNGGAVGKPSGTKSSIKSPQCVLPTPLSAQQQSGGTEINSPGDDTPADNGTPTRARKRTTKVKQAQEESVDRQTQMQLQENSQIVKAVTRTCRKNNKAT